LQQTALRSLTKEETRKMATLGRGESYALMCSSGVIEIRFGGFARRTSLSDFSSGITPDSLPAARQIGWDFLVD
jgi:hypothetical protein